MKNINWIRLPLVTLLYLGIFFWACCIVAGAGMVPGGGYLISDWCWFGTHRKFQAVPHVS